MTKDDKILNAHDDLIQARINQVLVLRKKPFPADLIEKHQVVVKFRKDEKQLGLSLRQGMVTRVVFESPFKGSLVVGDILIMINGTVAAFEGVSLTPKSKPFNVLVHDALSDNSPKIRITFVRLKHRIQNGPIPKDVTPIEGHTIETAMIYQFKYLKLGINIQQVGEYVVVNYTSPDTTTNISLNIGETILAIDGIVMKTMEEVRRKILESSNQKGMAVLTVSFPTNDMLRNCVRNQLAAASKDAPRPVFAIYDDVRQYAEDGIRAAKTAAEPDPIFPAGVTKTVAGGAQEKTQDLDLAERPSPLSGGTANSKVDKPKKPGGLFKVKKMLSFTKRDNKKEGFGFRDTVGEHDIPSEWNSKLFVYLPKMKTVETETNGAQQTSVYKKT